MRIFITIIICIFSFQTLANSDDIRDFEIEGMSIGDNALDFFTKEERKFKIYTELFQWVWKLLR